MISTKNEVPYLKSLQQVTADFRHISSCVRSIETDLAVLGHLELVACVRRIQEGERDKLRATMQLHALRKAEAFKSFSWQHLLGAFVSAPLDECPGVLSVPKTTNLLFPPSRGGGGGGRHHRHVGLLGFSTCARTQL
jgi:hypothetical protein